VAPCLHKNDSTFKIQYSRLKGRFGFKHRDTEDTKKKEKAFCVFSLSVLSVAPCLHKNDSRFKIQDLPVESYTARGTVLCIETKPVFPKIP
jgi:hypothetical protein